METMEVEAAFLTRNGANLISVRIQILCLKRLSTGEQCRNPKGVLTRSNHSELITYVSR